MFNLLSVNSLLDICCCKDDMYGLCLAKFITYFSITVLYVYVQSMLKHSLIQKRCQFACNSLFFANRDIVP